MSNNTTAPPKATITRFTAAKIRKAFKAKDGTEFPQQRIRMVKTFGLNEDGSLKKGQPGIINTGLYDSHIVDLSGLKELISSLNEQQALCHGTAEKPKGKIGFIPGKQIKRNKDNFTHKKGNSFFLIDIDGINIHQDTLLQILSELVPGFADAGKLLIPSSSSGLYGPDNELLKDSTSLHIYLIIKDGLDSDRFMRCLFDRLWLIGHGFYVVSGAPSLLKRAIIDEAVRGPERIIYEGEPILSDGVTQVRKEPLLIQGNALDTSLLLPLSAEEKGKLNDIYQLEKEKVDIAFRKATKAKVITTQKEQGCSMKAARKIVKDRQSGVLDGDLILYHSNGQMTVAELLEDGESNHKKEFADPLEPEYDGGSKTKSVFYWNGGERPTIRSYAHGVTNYTFLRFKKKKGAGAKDAEDDNRNLLEQMLDRFVYMRDGNKVVDLQQPPQHAVMKKEEFMTGFKALGKVVIKEKPVWAVNALFESSARKMVIGERYNPGKKKMYNQDGVEWFNTFHMPEWEETTTFDLIDIIFDHIEYLFPDGQGGRFLNWITWTIHEPQTRIKFTPLLISRHHGTGRGWLMELMELILGRWNCSTTDMSTLVGEGNDGAYQDYMHNVVMTYIAEVKVAGKKAYAVDDSIRAKLTDSPLPMNLKYDGNGTFPVFTNFCFMSNNFNAMLPPKEDRRIDVFEHFNPPQKEKYYDQLYLLLSDKKALAQFYWFTREIYELNKDDFNPLGRAIMSPAKRRLQNCTTNEIEEAVESYLATEKRDVIAYKDIKQGVYSYFVENGIEPHDAEDRVNKARQQLLSIAGKSGATCNEGKKVKINGNSIKLICIRNTERWLNSDISALRDEYATTAVVCDSSAFYS